MSKNTRGIKINTQIMAKPGDLVLVKNYRKRPEQWEQGQVHSVSIQIGKDIQVWPRYSVILTRRRTGRHEGKVIFLYVGTDGISPLNINKQPAWKP